MSSEHFSVDGTMLEAWASQKWARMPRLGLKKAHGGVREGSGEPIQRPEKTTEDISGKFKGRI